MGSPQTGPTASKLVVTMVVAASPDGIIGRGGDMPWRMPSSLKRFRALTMGRPMIMGRKTYASIGRPLDGRDTIVVTRNPDLFENGVHVVSSLEAALVLAARLAVARGTNEIIIAGGGEIYAAALPYATDIHLDRIDADVAGDTHFPALDPLSWEEVGRQPIAPQPRDEHAAAAVHYHRIGMPRPLPSA